MVTARTSRFSAWIMRTVSRISSLVMKTMADRPLDAVHEAEDVLVLHRDLQADLARRSWRGRPAASASVVSVSSNETNMIIVNMPSVTVWLTSSTLAFWSATVVATAASRPCLSGPRAVTMTLVRDGIGHGDLAVGQWPDRPIVYWTPVTDAEHRDATSRRDPPSGTGDSPAGPGHGLPAPGRLLRASSGDVAASAAIAERAAASARCSPCRSAPSR